MLSTLTKKASFLVLLLSFVLAFFYFGSPPADLFRSHMATLLGGGKPINPLENSVDLDDLGRFAVDQQNSRQNSDLTFVRLLSASQQVVSGTMYSLILEAKTGDIVNTYNAKVWVKPWQNFKSLDSFEPAREAPITKADLGAVTDGPATEVSNQIGLRAVPVDDPVIKEAAQKALEALQQRSNSLVPYSLKNVLSAQAEVNNDITKFELILKIGRGSHEEESMAKLERTVDGKWVVKESQLHRSAE